MRRLRVHRLLCAVALTSMLARGQTAAPETKIEVRMRLGFPQQPTMHHSPPAVLWLKPVKDAPSLPFPPHGRYTLVQKNRMFTPHLLVVPVGSVVVFPNEDPFFHNVFSQFDGKRFDLGLYEAGSIKEVKFSREGVSYVFCNIHPEMSAVVLALSTPFYAVADASGAFDLHDVPVGDYELHVWIEGPPQPELNRLVRDIHLAPGAGDLGELQVTGVPRRPVNHLNKFGQPYDQDSKPPY